MKASKFTDAQKAFVIKQGEEQRLWATLSHLQAMAFYAGSTFRVGHMPR